MSAIVDAPIAALVLIGAIAAYLLYHYGSRSAAFVRFVGGPSTEDGTAQLVHARRMFGAGALGIPAISSALFLPGGLTAHGVAVPAVRPALLFLAFVLVLVLPVVTLSSRRKKAWVDYPQLRYKTWSSRRFLHNALSWAAFLFAYELFFRGLLTFVLVHALGTITGLAVMTALYVAVHIDKPAGETIGTLPMGFVFGYCALESGSFVPVFIGHLAIALCSDFVAIRSNPSLTWSAAPAELSSAPASDPDRERR